MDEPAYTRGDRINAAFVLTCCAIIGAVALDVLFDLSGRWQGRRLAAETAGHVASRAAGGD